MLARSLFHAKAALGALSIAALVALSGCASSTAPVTVLDYASMPRAEGLGALSQLTARYRANPNDPAIIVNYAAALRAQGQAGQAVTVLETGVSTHPGHPDIAIAYAKALTADGRLEQALNVVDRAIVPETPDWNALSVRGAVLDQMGRNAEARAAYAQAMTIAPAEPSLYANMGLSYSLTDELPVAERYLRQAVALPRATSAVRQNLALVVGLQGRFSEAEALYAAELPAEDVASNMAYLRSMLAEPNRWDRLRDNG